MAKEVEFDQRQSHQPGEPMQLPAQDSGSHSSDIDSAEKAAASAMHDLAAGLGHVTATAAATNKGSDVDSPADAADSCSSNAVDYDCSGHPVSSTSLQVDSSGHQADSTGYQADSTGYQADSTGYQADSTGHQADSSGYQVDSTSLQEDSTGYQEDSSCGNHLSGSGLQADLSSAQTNSSGYLADNSSGTQMGREGPQADHHPRNGTLMDSSSTRADSSDAQFDGGDDADVRAVAGMRSMTDSTTHVTDDVVDSAAYPGAVYHNPECDQTAAFSSDSNELFSTTSNNAHSAQGGYGQEIYTEQLSGAASDRLCNIQGNTQAPYMPEGAQPYSAEPVDHRSFAAEACPPVESEGELSTHAEAAAESDSLVPAILRNEQAWYENPLAAFFELKGEFFRLRDHYIAIYEDADQEAARYACVFDDLESHALT